MSQQAQQTLFCGNVDASARICEGIGEQPFVAVVEFVTDLNDRQSIHFSDLDNFWCFTSAHKIPVKDHRPDYTCARCGAGTGIQCTWDDRTDRKYYGSDCCEAMVIPKDDTAPLTYQEMERIIEDGLAIASLANKPHQF